MATIDEVMKMLEGGKADIQKACPPHMTADYLIRCTKTALADNPDILKASAVSICRAVTHAAQLGLSVDPHMGEGALVPFKSTCIFMTQYQGLIALALRSEKVESVFAQVVYKNDTFRFQWGNTPTIEHQPCLNGERGDPLGAWAIALMKGAERPLMDWMSAADIDRIRQRSRAKDNGPWVTDPMEMWRKTVLRRLSKYLPKSRELLSAFAHEVDLDEIIAATRDRRARTVRGEIPGDLRQVGDLVPEHLSESLDPNRGHDDTGLDTARYESKWRKHFSSEQQLQVEAYMKREHGLVGDEAIDAFVEKYEGDWSDLLEQAEQYLAANTEVEAVAKGKTKSK